MSAARRAGHPPAREDQDLAARLSALAYPARLRLLRFLGRPAYLEEIARHLGVTRQAALKHVRTLERAGLVARRGGVRGGMPVVEYFLAPGGLFLLTGQLEHLASVPSEAAPGSPTLPVEGGAGIAVASQAGEHALVVVRGPSAGRRFPLPMRSGDVIVLGRGLRCAGSIPQDPFLSNRHAEVARVRPGLRLTDLRSTNGTFLNGAPLAGSLATPLRHGDIVGLGVTLLVVWDGVERSP